MSRWVRVAVLLLGVVVALEWWSSRSPGDGAPITPVQVPSSGATADVPRYPRFLPPEAVATLEAIARGGPFRYDRDGSVFQNRERRLPDQPRGYYREYTVETPGSPDRGARRIVSGGDPPEVYYYTDDHYRSFRRVEVRR